MAGKKAQRIADLEERAPLAFRTPTERDEIAELGEAILEEVEFSTAAHVHRVDGPVGCHHCRELTK